MMIAALYCAVSCGDELNPEQSGNVEYINVTSQVDAHTKAGYEGTTVLPEMFYIEIDQEGTDMDYRLPLSREESTANYKAETDLKWKGSAASVKAMTVPYGLTSVDMMNPMVVKIHQAQNDPENLKASDLLGASTQKKSIEMNGSNIVVSFNHLMSKLQVNYTKPDDIEVTSVVLENTCIQGGYTFKDMTYDQDVQTEYGDVTMYHDSEKSSAEAIFFPYSPISNPKLVVSAMINGQAMVFECPIVLRSDMAGFEGGKRYVMSVTISETGVTGVITMIKNWNGSASIADERILWIGTSIPACGYPQLVAQDLNCEIINNAVPGSLVLKVKDGGADMQKCTTKGVDNRIGFEKVADGQGTFIKDETTGEFKEVGLGQGNYIPYNILAWDAPGAVLNLHYGGLMESHASIESKYRGALTNISGDDSEWVEKWMKKLKESSYETLILPYINGTAGYPQCTTIILDHGFNDRGKMTNEAGGHLEGNEFDLEGDTWGQAYFGRVLRGQIDSVQYHKDLNSNHNILALGSKHEISYVMAMNYLIREIILKTNPDVRVIIGNYFSFDSPWVRNYWSSVGFYENFTAQICWNNEAVAIMNNLDVVNVYEHLYIPDGMFYDPAHCDPVNNNMDTSKFCPDGVHPINPQSLRAIADIYIRALRDILR